MKNKLIPRLYRFPTSKLDGDVLTFLMSKTLDCLEHLLNPDNRCAITDRNLFHGCRPDFFTAPLNTNAGAAAGESLRAFVAMSFPFFS